MSEKMLFPLDEFKRRYAAIQNEMVERDVDLLLLDQPELIFYVLGYAMSEGFQQFCLIPRQGMPLMILRSVDAGTLRDYSWIESIISYADWEDPIAIMAETVKERGWSSIRIGVDETSYNLTIQRFRQLQQAFPNSDFADFSLFLSRQRALKSEREIEYLRRSSQIADQALASILNQIKPGDSARDCVALAAQQIIRLGGDASVVGPVTKSLDENKMHALVDDNPLQHGDLLHVELIPQFMGYASRIMRPVHMGPPPSRLIDTAKQIVDLQDKQLEAMNPGVPACEIDSIVREGMLKQGLRTSYLNITGYSLGYYQLHTPRSSDFTYIFRPTDTWLLEPGMVFHMYTVASGLAFSETVRITPAGAERLTLSDRKLLHSIN